MGGMTGRKVGEKMADINITYSCGCGYKTLIIDEAITHSDEKQHSLTVLGTIKKDKKEDKIA